MAQQQVLTACAHKNSQNVETECGLILVRMANQVASHIAQELIEMNNQAIQASSSLPYLKESAVQVKILQHQTRASQMQKPNNSSAEGGIHDTLATQVLSNIAGLEYMYVPEDSPSKQCTQDRDLSSQPSNTIKEEQTNLGVNGASSIRATHDNTKQWCPESNSGCAKASAEDPEVYYVQTLEEVKSAIRNFEKRTGTKYTSYKTTAGFGNTVFSPDKKHKVYFRSQDHNCEFYIPYDGIPFINLGKKVMDCEYGVDRCVSAKKKYMERHLTDNTIIKRPLAQDRTKKIKCKAQISMKEVLKYPEFKLPGDSRKRKVSLSAALKKAMKNGTAMGEKRIYMKFPRLADHKDHPLGENAIKEIKPSLSAKQAMKQVNALSWDAFIQQFGNIVEHGQVVASAAWARRPFSSMKALLRAFCEYLDFLPQTGKEALFRCYPSLETDSSDVLSADSSSEFHKIGLQALPPVETLLLSQLNAKYRERFNFSFIVCMQELNKEGLLKHFQTRLQNSPETELVNALTEVKKIAWYRMLDQVRTNVAAASHTL